MSKITNPPETATDNTSTIASKIRSAPHPIDCTGPALTSSKSEDDSQILFLIQDLRKKLRIDIAAREHHADASGITRQFACEHSSGGRSSRRLDQDFRAE